MYKGTTIPVVYALLKNKSKQTYIQLYKKLFEILNIENFGDSTLMGDFELISSAFSNLSNKIKYCNFHLAQNVVKKARSICSKYNENFDSLKRRLIALSYLPLTRIKDAFNDLKQIYTSDNEKLLLEYFESNYINGKYVMERWCCYLDPVRSNNSCESYHRQLNSFINCSKPAFHKFSRRLFKFIENRRLFLSRLKKNQLPRPNVKFVERNFVLMNIMLKEKCYSNLDYLDCISEATKKEVKQTEYDVSFINDESELTEYEDSDFIMGDFSSYESQNSNDEMSQDSSLENESYSSSSSTSESTSTTSSESSDDSDSEVSGETSEDELEFEETKEDNNNMIMNYNSQMEESEESSESILDQQKYANRMKKKQESKPKK